MDSSVVFQQKTYRPKKLNVAGFLLIIQGSLMSFFGVAGWLVFALAFGMSDQVTGKELIDMRLMGLAILLVLVFGILDVFLGSAIRGHKRWAWRTGIITCVLEVIFFESLLIYSFFFYGFNSFYNSLPTTLLLVFTVYGLISEKKVFFITSQASPVPPVGQTV